MEGAGRAEGWQGGKEGRDDGAGGGGGRMVVWAIVHKTVIDFIGFIDLQSPFQIPLLSSV